MKPISLLLAAALPLATDLVAQSWTLPMDPRASYLRTNNDTPAPPLLLDLGAMGLGAGQWLRIGTVGAYRSVNGGPDTYRSLVGVFASSPQLLPDGVQQRVVGAIPAGPAVQSGPTFYGALPIDIAEDFDCSRFGYASSIEVQVPAGATHLFLGTHESLYSDNVDPNGDFAAVVSVVPTPSLPGTGEHLVLRSTTIGIPLTTPDTHATPAGATMTTRLDYPLGLIDGSLYVFLAEVVTTGAPVPSPLPGLWTPSLFVVQAGLLPAAAGFTDTWSLVAPAGYAGLTVLVQAGALTPSARNGLFETTAAHRFVLQ